MSEISDIREAFDAIDTGSACRRTTCWRICVTRCGGATSAAMSAVAIFCEDYALRLWRPSTRGCRPGRAVPTAWLAWRAAGPADQCRSCRRQRLEWRPWR